MSERSRENYKPLDNSLPENEEQIFGSEQTGDSDNYREKSNKKSKKSEREVRADLDEEYEALREEFNQNSPDLYNSPEKPGQFETKSMPEWLKATAKGLWYRTIYRRALKNTSGMYNTTFSETGDYVDELSKQNKKKIEQRKPGQHAVGSSWYKPPVWVNAATAPIRGWWYSTFSPNAVLKKIPGSIPDTYSEIANYIDWQRTKAKRPELMQSMKEISEKAATGYKEDYERGLRGVKRYDASKLEKNEAEEQASIKEEMRQGVAKLKEKERLEKEAKENAEKAEREIREKVQKEAERQKLEEETKKKAKEADRKARIEAIQKAKEEADQQRLKRKAELEKLEKEWEEYQEANKETDMKVAKSIEEFEKKIEKERLEEEKAEREAKEAEKQRLEEVERELWEKEKSELPYQESDIIKVSFGKEGFKDILISNITKKDGEIFVEFVYGENKEPWIGPYSYIGRWEKEYKKVLAEQYQSERKKEEEENEPKKEPWKMTRKDFLDAKIMSIFPHNTIVRKALDDGKCVPDKVLKEYPDLAKSYWESMGIDSEEIAKRLEKLSEMD